MLKVAFWSRFSFGDFWLTIPFSAMLRNAIVAIPAFATRMIRLKLSNVRVVCR